MTFLPIVLAAALSAGNAEFDEVAKRGASEIALRRIETELVSNGPAGGTLEKAMLDEPARFARPAEAEQLCRGVYKTALEDEFRRRARLVAERLGLDGKDCELAAAAEDRALATAYPKAFAAERAAAVAKQARAISGVVRPTEAEFESKDEPTLRREMTDKVVRAHATPVFEENVRYVSEQIVDPVIADGRREMKRQREYLARTRCEAYAPSALAREIEQNLRRNVAERQAKEKDPAKAWGLFPGVLKAELPAVIERRVVALATKEVDDVGLEVTADEILKVIAADPAAHRVAAESEQVFRAAYSAQLVGGALARAEKGAPEGERAEFADYVRAHAASPELSRAVEARLKREVLPNWRKARAEAAAREAERIWPSLADGTWYPEAEFADRMVARSDYAAAVKGWRASEEMETLAKADGGKVVMEETAVQADRSVAAAFDLARSAVSAQNAIVEAVQPSVLDEARSRKRSFFTRTPDFKAIVGLLTSAVEASWNEKRLATLWGDGERPSNAAEQHAALFPSVRKRIELVARQILEDMEKPEPTPEEKPQPEQKPEDPTDADAQSDEEPLQEFSIVIEKNGASVNVKLLQGKAEVEARTAPARMADFTAAVKAVAERLGRDLLKLP